MPDWTASMQQTFEYYIVDPGTWKDIKKINVVKSSSISRDVDSETLGSATFDVTESLGECYIRTYLITIQNGIREKFPLGTHLVQTPASSFDGKLENISIDAYTPLLELKENQPPIGYSIPKDENILKYAYKLTNEYARAPVINSVDDTNLYTDFVANSDDTWLTFITDLLSNAKHTFALDEIGRILFAPKQETASLQPVWTYDDGNSSILYPDFSLDHDMYGIPNVVEVIYSDGSGSFYAKCVNDDPNSPISTVNRGREIVYRETDPNMIGNPTNDQIQRYAKDLLKELSTLEYKVSYTHAYCPVRIGDCIRLNYSKIGLTNIKAKVISQSIDCSPGCPVSETAVFTTRLWR